MNHCGGGGGGGGDGGGGTPIQLGSADPGLAAATRTARIASAGGFASPSSVTAASQPSVSTESSVPARARSAPPLLISGDAKEITSPKLLNKRARCRAQLKRHAVRLNALHLLLQDLLHHSTIGL
jgi:hypothetical protein